MNLLRVGREPTQKGAAKAEEMFVVFFAIVDTTSTNILEIVSRTLNGLMNKKVSLFPLLSLPCSPLMNQRIDVIQLLRGLAALMVCCFHMKFEGKSGQF